MILSVCDEPTVMSVLRYVVLMIKILKAAIPIMLIITVMIKFASAITKHDNDLLAKATKSVVPNLIAAVLIFLVPTFVNLVVKISFPNSDYTKCISDVTIDTVNNAFNNKMDSLIAAAESSLEYSDYSSAAAYLVNIKDSDKKQEYENKLEAIKELINAKKESEKPNSGNSTVEYKDYGPCKVELKKVYVGHDKYEYGICVPERYNGEKLPMIMFLHGMTSDKESSFYTKFYSWASVGFNGALNEWPKYGLKNIPAIMVMPWSRGPDKWNNKWKYIHIDAVYNEVINNYNIDTDNVCLMGGSIGGQGVFTVAAQFPTRFRSLVPMSALITKPPAGDIEYFANMPMKGFAEKYNPKTHSESYNYERKMTELFNNIGHPNDLRVVPVKHMDVPGYALTIDDNGDGISDLVYWIINGGKDPEL
jgi:pimeloyl-ACP methyl ester carboxylesterase